MITSEYLDWFNQEFEDTQTLIWCATEASPKDALIAYGATPKGIISVRLSAHDPIDYPVSLLAGRIGSGILLVDRYRFDPADRLRSLSRLGQCLSVNWSDFSPDVISYADQGEILVRFDPKMRDESVADLVYPSVAEVDQWILSTAAGRSAWDKHWPTALLETAEALVGASIDPAWTELSHLGVLASSSESDVMPVESGNVHPSVTDSATSAEISSAIAGPPPPSTANEALGFWRTIQEGD
ncbi:hypothetical protein [Nonomuraea sp. NPDC005692]|uniref:hypothetical protein n=1 Tax=Nonomuraea sp. NPDC005692 TaxID=3157168 RepID=UPI003408D340